MTTGWTAATDTEDLPPRYDFALSELFSYDYSHIFRISYYLGTQPIFLYFDHKMLIRLLQPGLGFPGGTSGKEPACQCRRCKWWEFDPWVRKIPWKKAQQPTPVGSCLENPMDRGAWWAHSWAWLMGLNMQATRTKFVCSFNLFNQHLFRSHPPAEQEGFRGCAYERWTNLYQSPEQEAFQGCAYERWTNLYHSYEHSRPLVLGEPEQLRQSSVLLSLPGPSLPKLPTKKSFGFDINALSTKSSNIIPFF